MCFLSSPSPLFVFTRRTEVAFALLLFVLLHTHTHTVIRLNNPIGILRVSKLEMWVFKYPSVIWRTYLFYMCVTLFSISIAKIIVSNCTIIRIIIIVVEKFQDTRTVNNTPQEEAQAGLSHFKHSEQKYNLK